MSVINKAKLAEKIISSIWDDLSDRRGIELDALDEEIQKEIKEAWKELLLEILKEHK